MRRNSIFRRKKRLPGWRRFTRAEGGSALVETALILALLGPPLLLGTVEIGGALNASIEMSNAAYAGAAYAAQYYIQHTSSALPTATQVTAAVRNEAPELLNQLAPSTSLTVNMATGCGTGSPTAGNSVPSCSTGVQPFVQVTTQASVSPLIRFPGLTNLLTLRGGAVIKLVH
jgi:Flp pilus assembly protein TadG